MTRAGRFDRALVRVFSERRMHPELPPPDPHERGGETPLEIELAEPAMWFPLGAPSPDARRLAGKVLEFRPGALLVFDGLPRDR